MEHIAFAVTTNVLLLQEFIKPPNFVVTLKRSTVIGCSQK